jgi:hypothetical protein
VVRIVSRLLGLCSRVTLGTVRPSMPIRSHIRPWVGLEKVDMGDAFSSCRGAKNTDGAPLSAHLSSHDSSKASANAPRYLACRHLARAFRASQRSSFVQRRAVWYLVPRIQHETWWFAHVRVPTFKASPPYHFVLRNSAGMLTRHRQTLKGKAYSLSTACLDPRRDHFSFSTFCPDFHPDFCVTGLE